MRPPEEGHRGEPDAAVLDRNLELLLRRSYVPALPRPDFRRSLEPTFLAEFERVHVHRRRPRRVLRLATLVTAAVVLVAALLDWKLSGGEVAPASWESIVARGQVAYRRGPTDAWSAADAQRPLALDGSFLEAIGAEALAIDADGGRILAAAHSRVRVGVEPAGLALSLAVGEARCEHGGASAWRISFPHGEVRLDAGELEFEVERDRAALTLEAGRAALLLDAGATPLALGQRTLLAHGALVLPHGAPGGELVGGTAGGRQPTGAGASPDDTDGADVPTEAPGGALVRGRVLDAVTREPVPAFRVALLRKRRSNEMHMPELHDVEAETGVFALPGIRPEEYTVFVHAPGYAVRRVATIALAEGDELELEVELERGGALRGHVVDATTGNPVPGALVLSETDTPAVGLPLFETLYEPYLPASARTLVDGSFELPHLSVGAHVLRVTATGYGATWVADVDMTAEGSAAAVTVELHPGGGVRGRILAPPGAPRPGTRLVVTGVEQGGRSIQNFALIQADEEGRYEVDDLAPGLYLVILADQVQGGGTEFPEVKFVPVRAGAFAELNFETAPDGARVRGTIRYADGRPAADLSLSLNPFRTNYDAPPGEWYASSTASDGTFAFEGVAPGRFQLCLALGMGRTILLLTDFEVEDWTEVEEDVTLRLGTITGKVSDAATGEPVSSAWIVLDHAHPENEAESFAGKASVDPSGRFTLPFLPEGDYVLTAYDPSGRLGAERSREVRLFADEPDAAPSDQIDFVLAPGGSATIEVVDADGAGIDGAIVTFVDADGRNFLFPESDFGSGSTKGVYEAKGIRPGTWTIRVARDGYLPTEQRLEFRAGATDRHRLVLERADDDR